VLDVDTLDDDVDEVLIELTLDDDCELACDVDTEDADMLLSRSD